MGSAIAEKISESFPVVGFDIDKSKRDAMNSMGIETEETLEGVVSKVDIVILSMPKASISKRIVMTIAPLMKSDAIIIETSTILPNEANELKELAANHDIRLIDAAILGGVGHMRSKTAVLLVGDSENIVSEVKEILNSFSIEVQVMGGVGAGMSAKIINNGVAHAVMSVIVESAALAVKLGIEPEKVYELLKGETALIRPLTHRYHERIQNGEYKGGMSTSNAKKDSTLFLQLAQEQNVPLFSVQGAHTVYEIAEGQGFGQEDYAAIAKLWENWSNVDFSGQRRGQHESLQNAY